MKWGFTICNDFIISRKKQDPEMNLILEKAWSGNNAEIMLILEKTQDPDMNLILEKAWSGSNAYSRKSMIRK